MQNWGTLGSSHKIPECKADRTVVTVMAFARTEGYYAPEIALGQLSAKADVYSYSVVSMLLKFTIHVVHLHRE